jgi:hypothetical protein
MAMTYKTFRWRIHANTPTDIDTVLNTLPAGTFVEGYAKRLEAPHSLGCGPGNFG